MNETLHQIHLFYCNNSSCIQLPEVIKVKQVLKSLVSWLAVLHDADKLFDIFCYDNKQRKPYGSIMAWE